MSVRRTEEYAKDIDAWSSDSDDGNSSTQESAMAPRMQSMGGDNNFPGTWLLVSALVMSIIFLSAVSGLSAHGRSMLAKAPGPFARSRALVDPETAMSTNASRMQEEQPNVTASGAKSSTLRDGNNPEMWRTVGASTTDSTSSSPSAACGESEELFEHLCYKTCALLTNGEFPVRRTSNACSKSATANMRAEISVKGIFCEGYQVATDNQCPHPPATGNCDSNEELHLGKCFRTCSSLTDGKYPIRAAANTCCKQKPCFNPFHLKTSGIGCAGFGVGGGQDGHKCPHKPNPDSATQIV